MQILCVHTGFIIVLQFPPYKWIGDSKLPCVNECMNVCACCPDIPSRLYSSPTPWLGIHHDPDQEKELTEDAWRFFFFCDSELTSTCQSITNHGMRWNSILVQKASAKILQCSYPLTVSRHHCTDLYFITYNSLVPQQAQTGTWILRSVQVKLFTMAY